MLCVQDISIVIILHQRKDTRIDHESMRKTTTKLDKTNCNNKEK